MKNPLLALLICLCLMLWGQTLSADVVIDVDFNAQPVGPVATQPKTDPLPLALPTGVITDAGCTVEVVASAGDLTAKPLLLYPVAGGLASAAFHNPTVSSTGLWTVSWDALVLDKPVITDPYDGQFQIVKSDMASAWGMKYNDDWTLTITDGSGFKIFGNFRLGMADHFDLYLDLDGNTYDLWMNGSSATNGNISPSADFSHTYFRSNGRGTAQDPTRFVFDNVKVSVVPEPLSICILASGGLVLLLRRRADVI